MTSTYFSPIPWSDTALTSSVSGGGIFCGVGLAATGDLEALGGNELPDGGCNGFGTSGAMPDVFWRLAEICCNVPGLGVRCPSICTSLGIVYVETATARGAGRKI